MNRRLKAVALSLLTTLILSGCGGLTLGPKVETKIIWETIGTPAQVTDDREIEVLVPDAGGKKAVGRVNPAGRMLIDRPTYDMLLDCWERSKGGAVKQVAPKQDF